MADRHDIPDGFWDLASLLPKKRPPVMRERTPDVETVTLDIGVPEKGAETEHGIGSLSVRFREVRPETPVRDVDIAVRLKIPPKADGSRVPERSEASPPTATAPIQITMTNPMPMPTPMPTPKPTPRPTTDTVEVAHGAGRTAGNGSDMDGDRLRLPPRESVRASVPRAELIDEYEPESGLIRRVRIMRWASKYSFYEQFRFDAKRYAEIRGEECPAVDFFSYTPQYRQMTKAQLRFYFWWRECARRGEYIPAAFSYVLLYIYETINLHETKDPASSVSDLVGVWLAYRGKYKVLDKYLSEWVADLCLIHRLPAPREELLPIMPAVMENASFREFYMECGDGGITPSTLIELSSDYNYLKSKFAVESAAVCALYRRHIPAAVGFVAERSRDERFSTRGMKSAVVSRDAFCGSLCAHNVKCRIDIEYLSYVRSHELRALLTELVKYCENRLRAALGIRSRLHVRELDEKLRALADEYFDREFPTSKKPSAAARAAQEEAEYEASYDALSHGVDSITAQELERASWASTELLASELSATDAEEANIDVDEALDTASETNAEAADIDADTDPDFAEDGTAADVAAPPCAFDEDAAGYLRLLLAGDDDGAREYCRERSLYADELAARINEAAAEIFGDIAVEPDGDGGYTIIEDYRDELTGILN